MNYIDVVFDGPPSHESGRFVEVEDPAGKSISAGEWIDRGNGLWALRIQRTFEPACRYCAAGVPVEGENDNWRFHITGTGKHPCSAVGKSGG